MAIRGLLSEIGYSKRRMVKDIPPLSPFLDAKSESFSIFSENQPERSRICFVYPTIS